MKASTSMEMDVGVLYGAICGNSWEKAKQILDQHPSALTARLTPTNATPLHVAALFGHSEMVDELLKLASPETLELADDHGSTPLAAAASTGAVRVAERMLRKNRNAIGIPDKRGHLPVASAIGAGQRRMGRFLYKETPLEVLKPQNGHLGPRLLRACFEAGELGVALDLLERCEDIVFAPDQTGWAPYSSIASLPYAVETASQLGFLKRCIYPFIPTPPTTTMDEVCVEVHQEAGSKRRFQGMYELKQLQAQSSEILKLLCRRVPILGKKCPYLDEDTEVLTVAAREGLVDFLSRVSETYPQSLQFTPEYGNWNIFFLAIRYRQAEVFSLIHRYRFKNLAASVVDTSGNCMLHVAAKLTPSNQLNRVSGAALQMQREMQWFKEVESVVPLGLRVSLNSDRQRPEDIFKATHRDLRDAGEKWMKDTASSCSVVGALIVTMMFAVAFTVPGGNDQNDGYPVFLKDDDNNKLLFILFMVSDALSLFSSTTCVLTFLGILTSRYAEEDFLTSLPKKLIIGLSALFVSILTMMAAFCLCIVLMLRQTYPWSYLPVFIVAGVPVALFVWLQFPLLLDVISSTYGPGIFKTKR
ncbi:unnamed protein product [Cuscuta campestris]|uniref:PGG domain-containing protein n=1 Tax=Cuscuta campestris TaxID=132261 RepID=A0A484LD19_9ASTE|nr:unnamed protein product [Cuscuta campestris]